MEFSMCCRERIVVRTYDQTRRTQGPREARLVHRQGHASEGRQRVSRRDEHKRAYICLEVWMCERVLYSNPLLRIKRLVRHVAQGQSSSCRQTMAANKKGSTHQCPREEVDCEWVRVREELREWLPFPEGQRADVVSRPARRDRIELVKRRCPEHVED